VGTRQKPGAERPSRGPRSRAAPRRGVLGEDVYARLKHDIQTLVLPPRSALDEVALVRRFGVSRTPIREALRRLAADALVELVPHQSARVSPILLDGVRDYFEALGVLQKVVLVLSVQRATASMIVDAEALGRSIEAAARKRDGEAIPELNMAFHLALARGADNHFLLAAYERLMDQGLRLSGLTMRYYLASDWATHLEALVRDHREMLRAMEERDVAAIAGLSDRHVVLFRDNVLSGLVGDRQSEPGRSASDLAIEGLIGSRRRA